MSVSPSLVLAIIVSVPAMVLTSGGRCDVGSSLVVAWFVAGAWWGRVAIFAWATQSRSALGWCCGGCGSLACAASCVVLSGSDDGLRDIGQVVR